MVIGQGVIDLAPILAWGEQNGTQGYVVEQDITEGDALGCVRTSLAHLNRLAGGLTK